MGLSVLDAVHMQAGVTHSVDPFSILDVFPVPKAKLTVTGSTSVHPGYTKARNVDL